MTSAGTGLRHSLRADVPERCLPAAPNRCRWGRAVRGSAAAAAALIARLALGACVPEGAPFPPESTDGSADDPCPSGSDVWCETTTAGVPEARAQHTAVWTGTEMIVWGGIGERDGIDDFRYFDTGGRYDPAGDTWAPTATNGAAERRGAHTAVWTGTEMIVWGGAGIDESESVRIRTGARYDPGADAWTQLPSATAPAARMGHTAVWTGTEMIVWGGSRREDGNVIVYLSSGGRYSPATNTWTATTLEGAPSPRRSHSATWTGTEMIVWGGHSQDDSWLLVLFADGARYDPVADAWTPVETDGAPEARTLHTAVWTGEELLVWGGGTIGIGPVYFEPGGRYDPASDTWSPISTENAPAPRENHTAVWTGGEMIVWGGFAAVRFDDGARYDVAADAWVALSSYRSPAERAWHTAVWAETQMIVWGGRNGLASGLSTGGRYRP